MELTMEQVERYEEDGFLVIANYFSEAELGVLSAEIPRTFAEDTPRRILERSGAVRSVFAPHRTNAVFDCLSRLERLVKPAMQLLEGEVYIHQYKINAKVALDGDQWEWHQDYLYWNKEDGMPEPRVLTAVLFLQDVDDFNGPLLVIPGSHKVGMIDLDPVTRIMSCPPDGSRGNGGRYAPATSWMPTLTADLKYKIDREILSQLLLRRSIRALKGTSGFVVFFHGNLFHASAGNLSASDRISIFVTYNSVANALPDLEHPRPDFIAHRDYRPLECISNDALLRLDPRLHAMPAHAYARG